MSYSFTCEPREWFSRRHYVTFSMSNPDMVMHRPVKTCRIECPHHINECGEFKVKPAKAPRGPGGGQVKYGNKKTTASNGEVLDSKREARRLSCESGRE